MTKRNKPIAGGDMWRVYAGIAVLPITSSDKAVLAVLVDHANSEGKAWPSIETIGERLKRPVRCVKRSIANLIRAKLVARKRRMRASNVYEVKCEAILDAWERTRVTDAARQEAAKGDKPGPSGVTDAAPLRVTNPAHKQEQREQEHRKGISVSESFDAWWAIYPRKVAKKTAERTFTRIVQKREATEAELIEGAKRYAAKVKRERTEERFIKHPGTWLNGGCWSDEAPASKPKRDPATHGDEWDRRAAELLAVREADEALAAKRTPEAIAMVARRVAEFKARAEAHAKKNGHKEREVTPRDPRDRRDPLAAQAPKPNGGPPASKDPLH